MLRRRTDSAEAGRNLTPLRASGISATMTSALKITEDVIAEVGVKSFMALSEPSEGYAARNIAGMLAKYLATSLATENVLKLSTPPWAITSAVIFNALVIVALIPLA